MGEYPARILFVLEMRFHQEQLEDRSGSREDEGGTGTAFKYLNGDLMRGQGQHSFRGPAGEKVACFKSLKARIHGVGCFGRW